MCCSDSIITSTGRTGGHLGVATGAHAPHHLRVTSRLPVAITPGKVGKVWRKSRRAANNPPRSSRANRASWRKVLDDIRRALGRRSAGLFSIRRSKKVRWQLTIRFAQRAGSGRPARPAANRSSATESSTGGVGIVLLVPPFGGITRRWRLRLYPAAKRPKAVLQPVEQPSCLMCVALCLSRLPHFLGGSL